MSALFKTTVTPKDWMAVAGILAILGLVIVAFVFVLRGRQKEALAELAANETLIRTELADAQTKRDNIRDLREEMAKTEKLVSEFEKRLPSKGEIPTLITQFEALATRVGLRVVVDPQERQRDERKITIPYNIKAYGDFHQIASFINRLERFERYLKISDMKIKEEKQGVSEAEFTMSTYQFIQPAPKPPQATPATTGGTS